MLGPVAHHVPVTVGPCPWPRDMPRASQTAVPASMPLGNIGQAPDLHLEMPGPPRDDCKPHCWFARQGARPKHPCANHGLAMLGRPKGAEIGRPGRQLTISSNAGEDGGFSVPALATRRRRGQLRLPSAPRSPLRAAPIPRGPPGPRSPTPFSCRHPASFHNGLPCVVAPGAAYALGHAWAVNPRNYLHPHPRYIRKAARPC